jgi:hypothetical protein
MTTVNDPRVDDYLRRVRAALADLPAETREELLEEEPAHLAEVLDEGSLGLEERLGTPEAYAAELRAAAGLPLATGAPRGPAVATDLLRRGRVLAARADRAGGNLLGYARLADLWRLLRPGWWVLRGYLVGLLILDSVRGDSMARLLPVGVGDGVFAWLFVVVACVVASVRIGQLTPGFATWGRRLVGASAVLIAFLAAANLAPSAYEVEYFPTTYDPYAGVTDIYPYDKSGNLLNGVVLYDQNGNQIQIGDAFRCAQARNVGDSGGVVTYLYPLCPAARIWYPQFPTTDPSAPPSGQPVDPSAPPSGGTSPAPPSGGASPAPSAPPSPAG